jgi:hypothetical protein
MRRLYPDVAFDWKKIAQQLAEKRKVCRRYRSRRRNPDTTRLVDLNQVPLENDDIDAMAEFCVVQDDG